MNIESAMKTHNDRLIQKIVKFKMPLKELLEELMCVNDMDMLNISNKGLIEIRGTYELLRHSECRSQWSISKLTFQTSSVKIETDSKSPNTRRLIQLLIE